MNKETTPVQIAVRIVIIIVAIVILLLISFAMIRLVPTVFSSLSRFRETLSFFRNRERVSASFDKKVIYSEENAVLSWRKQGGSAEGKYSISYTCDSLDEDTYIEVVSPMGTSTVFCDESEVVGEVNADPGYQKATIKGFSEVAEDQVLKFVISHEGATSTLASSTATLTIKGKAEENYEDNDGDEEEKDETDRETDTDNNVDDRATSTPSYTPADLFVIFTRTNIDDEDATVTFEVTNYGGTATGPWQFKATLPRDGQKTYESPYQSSIPAGKTSIMTLSFNNAKEGTVEVIVDQNNRIKESNEGNNRATARID